MWKSTSLTINVHGKLHVPCMKGAGLCTGDRAGAWNVRNLDKNLETT